jgi:hypothetical protein
MIIISTREISLINYSIKPQSGIVMLGIGPDCSGTTQVIPAGANTSKRAALIPPLVGLK